MTLILSLFFSTCHKDVGCLYILFGVWSGLVGSAFSLLIRLELGLTGTFLVDDAFYLGVVTRHALLMIFFLVMPTLIGGFGNWLLPLMLGCSDIAFPRLNALSFWLLPLALSLMLLSGLLDSGVGSG